jgi:CheY-like chemotaxis protein
MPHSGKVRLLIVEDDANIRFLLETAAQRSDRFEAITATVDGQAALDLLRASDASSLPSLIVSDLSMPRMTGLELLRRVKSDRRMRTIPVAIITSSDAPKDRDLALGAGACSFVHKPCGVDALTRALVTIVDSCGEAAGATSSV